MLYTADCCAALLLLVSHRPLACAAISCTISRASGERCARWGSLARGRAAFGLRPAAGGRGARGLWAFVARAGGHRPRSRGRGVLPTGRTVVAAR